MSADRTEEDGGDDEAQRVDRMAIGRGEELDQEPRRTERSELRHRAGGRQRAVGAHEIAPRHDRRQEGVVGGVEERRQHGDEERHQQQQRQRQPAAERGQRDESQENRRDPGRPRSSPAAGGADPPTRPPRARCRGRRSAPCCAPSATPTASAFSVRMATNGSATRVTSEPKIEIVAALQTRRNAPLRQSDCESTGSGRGCSSWSVGMSAIARQGTGRASNRKRG